MAELKCLGPRILRRTSIRLHAQAGVAELKSGVDVESSAYIEGLHAQAGVAELKSEGISCNQSGNDWSPRASRRGRIEVFRRKLLA